MSLQSRSGRGNVASRDDWRRGGLGGPPVARGAASCVARSPGGGGLLATAHVDGTVRVLDASSFRVVEAWSLGAAQRACAWAPLGFGEGLGEFSETDAHAHETTTAHMLASGGCDGTVRVWRVELDARLDAVSWRDPDEGVVAAIGPGDAGGAKPFPRRRWSACPASASRWLSRRSGGRTARKRGMEVWRRATRRPTRRSRCSTTGRAPPGRARFPPPGTEPSPTPPPTRAERRVRVSPEAGRHARSPRGRAGVRVRGRRRGGGGEARRGVARRVGGERVRDARSERGAARGRPPPVPAYDAQSEARVQRGVRGADGAASSETRAVLEPGPEPRVWHGEGRDERV